MSQVYKMLILCVSITNGRIYYVIYIPYMVDYSNNFLITRDALLL